MSWTAGVGRRPHGCRPTHHDGIPFVPSGVASHESDAMRLQQDGVFAVARPLGKFDVVFADVVDCGQLKRRVVKEGLQHGNARVDKSPQGGHHQGDLASGGLSVRRPGTGGGGGGRRTKEALESMASLGVVDWLPAGTADDVGWRLGRGSRAYRHAVVQVRTTRGRLVGPRPEGWDGLPVGEPWARRAGQMKRIQTDSARQHRGAGFPGGGLNLNQGGTVDCNRWEGSG